MSDHIEDLKSEDVSTGERPPSIPPELPILPLRDTVLFPNSFMPLAVARESSVRLIDEAISGGKLIGVFTQRDASIEEPQKDDLHLVGTASHIHKMFKLPDGSLRLIVQGLSRLTLEEVVETKPYLKARVTQAVEALNDSDRLVASRGFADDFDIGARKQAGESGADDLVIVRNHNTNGHNLKPRA